MLTKIKNYIKKNELEEALNLLDEFTQDSKFNDEVIGYIRVFKELEEEQRKGFLSFNEYKMNKSRLVNSILKLLNELNNLTQKTFDSNFEFEKLISGDESNLIDIAFLEKALRAQKSVCKVKTSDGSGTGFLISKDGIILTNNHVIDNKQLLQNTKLIFNYQKDIFGNSKETLEYELDTTYYKTNKKLDFSFIKINNFKDNSKWGFLRLTKNINVNDKVYIIQHPKGEDKKIAMADNRVTEIEKPYIRYRVDTLKGSSGSPIFNENFEVIGLHHAGVNGKEANQGILISSIFNL